MAIIEDWIIKEGAEFRAELGDFREVKIKRQADALHSVRIATGKTWDMDHFVTHGLSLDGLMFLRKQSIVAEVNVDRYDKVNFVLSLGEIPDVPENLPGLDQDRELFEWFREQEVLVMVFKTQRFESFMGKVEVVGEKGCKMRLVNDELEVADELFDFPYSRMNVLVTGTNLLRLFEKYLEEMAR
jgi:hypothetical protein